MAKSLFIAEKPSVAQEFAKALKENMKRGDGFLESDSYVVTWCVGHLVTMSYPEVYDEKYKRWSLGTLPFIPDTFRYEVIPGVKKQFGIVSRLLNRQDVETIYVCTDSGREGEYIYRLVEQEAGVKGKRRKRVWIDSQTEEEIHRGIREAKDLSEYDNLAHAAYLRAKEDYLMGINFSRLLTLKYGNTISAYLKQNHTVISVGRVMTCVLGMTVRREREIRQFVKMPFYRVLQRIELEGKPLEGEFRALEGSAYFQSPKLYKENGFREKIDAQALCTWLADHPAVEKLLARLPEAAKTQAEGRLAAASSKGGNCSAAGAAQASAQREDPLMGNRMPAGGGTPAASESLERTDTGNGTAQAAGRGTAAVEPSGMAGFLGPVTTLVESVEKKKEKKNPPLLYNLAELQNDCSKLFKISPDETLRIVQELYEKKLVTYPRTDARVLSTAVAKEIHKNISGLQNFEPAKAFSREILEGGSYKNIAKTRYVNDKQITDHYAIIPTGQGLGALKSLKGHSYGVYAAIVRRFLGIFYPAAEYTRVNLVTAMQTERFYYSFRVLTKEGYFRVAGNPYEKRQSPGGMPGTDTPPEKGDRGEPEGGEEGFGADFLEVLKKLKKGMNLPVQGLSIREGETSPPKRYNSGSMILAMENAGQLIEDEELRAQIKGCGIGTSATRAEILKKLVTNKYVALNQKTQILSPTLMGEMIYDVVNSSIRSLLNPELTASWEKGLNYVAEGTITEAEYMGKLEHFIRSRTEGVLALNNQYALRPLFDGAAQYYRAEKEKGKGKRRQANGNVQNKKPV